MTFSAAAVLGLSLMTSAAQAQETQKDKLPSAASLIQKMVKAMGGEANFRKHKHVTLEGTLDIPSQGISAAVKIHNAAPNLSVSRFEGDQVGVFLRGYNGKVAWRDDPQSGPLILDGLQLEQAKIQADFYAILNYKKNFKTIKTVGITEFGGKNCYELELTTKGGDVQNLYIETETYMNAGGWTMVATPNGDFEVTTIYEDYKVFDGQQIAMMTRANVGGFVDQNLSFTSVSFEKFDHEVFELPDSIKELMKEKGAASKPEK